MLKQEHQEIIHSIDRALDSVARSCEKPVSAGEPWPVRPPIDSPIFSTTSRRSSSTAPVLSNATDLDLLVRRVQAAIGDDPPRSPEFKRFFNSYSPYGAEEEPSPGTSVCSEMSLASQDYLKKYGLMPSSPTQRVRSARNHHPYSYQPVRPSKLTYGQVYEAESPPYYSKAKQQKQEADLDDLENVRVFSNML